MNLICRLCRGFGSLFTQQNGSHEWYVCPACGGCGVRAVFGPATIKYKPSRKRSTMQTGNKS